MADSLIPKRLGPRIGEGRKRKVYEHPTRLDLVVKITKRKPLANFREKAIWDALQNHDARQWLARVYEISSDGRTLIQERLELTNKTPENPPEWMAEIQPRHWGYARDGSLKHCDFEADETCRKLKKYFGIIIK